MNTVNPNRKTRQNEHRHTNQARTTPELASSTQQGETSAVIRYACGCVERYVNSTFRPTSHNLYIDHHCAKCHRELWTQRTPQT